MAWIVLTEGDGGVLLIELDAEARPIVGDYMDTERGRQVVRKVLAGPNAPTLEVWLKEQEAGG